MQLILNSETDITIQRKMAAIEQEAFDEKFMDVLTDELDKEIATIKKEYIEKNTNDNNITNDDDKLLEEKLNENSINNTDQNEPNNDTITSSNECDEPIEEIAELVENNESETIENISDHEENHNNDSKVTDLQSKEKTTKCIETKVVKQYIDNEIVDNIQEIVINNEKQATEIQDNTVEIKETFEKKAESNEEDTITECVESDEVIDIADEIKEDGVEDKNIFDIEENTVSMHSLDRKQETEMQDNTEIKENFEKRAESNEDDTITECVESDEVIDIADGIKEDCIEDKNICDIEENTVSMHSLDIKQKIETQDNTIEIKETFEKKAECNEEDTIMECVESDEVIDIADETKEDGVEDKNIFDIEENRVSMHTLDMKCAFNTQSSDKENTTSAMQSANNLTEGQNIDVECNEKEQNEKIESLTKKIVLVNKLVPKGDQETVHKQETTNYKSSNDVNKDSNKLPLVCKLSNTLDILSDDEEEGLLKEESSKEEKTSRKEPSKKEPSDEEPSKEEPSNKKPSNEEPVKEESQKEELNCVKKLCINSEDDDVIMLIDEDPNPKDDKNCIENDVEKHAEEFICQEIKQINGAQEEPAVEKEIVLESTKDEAKTEKPILSKKRQEEEITEKQPVQKSLLPVNFLKTCKKNLADMTREELEEFCILKIVESVVDRSNLNEIKSQLNTMSQNIEEYKKKAMLLLKQNRDLQVVLKSVQEEQKKRSDVPITPLKITRSVGMQVFMTDKMVAQKKSLVGPNNLQNNLIGNSTPNRQNKSQINQTPKTQKAQINTNNTNQIPVPRLVPAVNNSMNSKQPSVTNSTAKTAVTPTTPNGIRNSPPVKAEKRPHSKLQQGNSVTVDLTDDEPPSKILQRNMTPPVRLVPPQNLLAPQRQQFGSTISSPRKVYIPISGSQNQVRPGQAIMLKPVIPSGPRQRVPNILHKPNLNIGRMPRLAPRHPPPLPDCIKQYQPPNWKALPPAPDLKLSKVDNGIVISWKIDDYNEDNHEEIASYQLYAYQETCSPASTSLWKKIGDVKALPLPMACTLTQFMSGYKYHFAVRAVDIRSRLGPFSVPGNILLLK